ncbi:hypothetical protein [Sphingobium sp. D43FB]|uniref:hypothetical protein n=1 Tax=Sphingobium sp. D43FB TaxID=2017595 RepID=UPI000BB52D89|nr:hypothetical protein [Sphingobium sp. D43FB]PBN42945.1 hypothetical protein SxD43FB_14025 [Sphingobium sp. D43FB]
MDEAMMREAAQALAARLNRLLNASMASEIVLSREEALLALGFTESVVELLAPGATRRQA